MGPDREADLDPDREILWGSSWLAAITNRAVPTSAEDRWQTGSAGVRGAAGWGRAAPAQRLRWQAWVLLAATSTVLRLRACHQWFRCSLLREGLGKTR